MNNDVTDSALLKSVSKPSGGFDLVKIFSASAIALILLIACPVLVLAVYWLEVDDNPPATIVNIHFHPEVDSEDIVDEAVARPGGSVWFGADFCKFTTAAVSIRRAWINDVIYTVPPPSFAPPVFPVGCMHAHVRVDVPGDLRPGIHTLQNTFEYPINPIKTRYVTFDVEPIVVSIIGP